MDLEKNYKQELISELDKLDNSASPTEIQVVTSKFFKENIWVSKTGRTAFTISILLAIITLIIIITKHNKPFDLFAYAAWTIVPPSWFLLEYTWLFPDYARFDANQLSDLKYKHELAGKIWGGLVILITAIIYLKYNQKI